MSSVAILKRGVSFITVDDDDDETEELSGQ